MVEAPEFPCHGLAYFKGYDFCPLYIDNPVCEIPAIDVLADVNARIRLWKREPRQVGRLQAPV